MTTDIIWYLYIDAFIGELQYAESMDDAEADAARCFEEVLEEGQTASFELHSPDCAKMDGAKEYPTGYQQYDCTGSDCRHVTVPGNGRCPLTVSL